MEIIDLIIKTMLIVLFFITVFYVRKLRNSLGKVRNVNKELRTAVVDFDHGTRSAEAAIAEMNETAKLLSGQLRHVMALRDDLTFLSERGETLADRLDTLVRVVRAMEKTQEGNKTILEPIIDITGSQSKLLVPTTRALSQAERSLLTILHEQK